MKKMLLATVCGLFLSIMSSAGFSCEEEAPNAILKSLEDRGLPVYLPPRARQLTSSKYCPQEPFLLVLKNSLNFSYPGLESIGSLFSKGQDEDACQALVEYYRVATTAEWLRANHTPTPTTTRVGGIADNVLKDFYDFYGEKGYVPKVNNSGYNWTYCPPPNFDSQWELALQRHEYFISLAQAWYATGNAVYSSKLNALVEDWVVYAGLAPSKTSNTFRCGGPPDWLTLDTGIRLEGPWPDAFFLLQNSSEFAAGTRLLLLASSAIQADYLARPSSQSTVANWEATQSSGLITTALVYPEFKNASLWLKIGSDSILSLMSTGVYPDGVSTEQTAGYDQVALRTYDSVSRIYEDSGTAVPPLLIERVEEMYSYLAFQMSADGTQILNGDSDLNNLRDIVAQESSRFNRSDWQYIVSGGEEGTYPEGNGSSMYDWAGQLIMQTQWGGSPTKQKLWGWFDVGPYGSSCHSHRDKLHLSIRAHGEHLLVDSGRFAYEGALSDFRSFYGSLTHAHNTLQIDSAQQVGILGAAKAPILNTSWAISEDSDFAFSSTEFERLNGTATHTRGVKHIRVEGLLVVVDRVITDRPRNITAFWHAHPNCSISSQPSLPETGPAGINVIGQISSLAVNVATGTHEWDEISVVRGVDNRATGGGLQGWYSEKYDDKQSAPVAVFNAHVERTTTFVWVIQTSDSIIPPKIISASVIGDPSAGSVDVQVIGTSYQEQISVPMN